ncbi:hypothetical protein ANN_09777 [Periplaneta americana]|uniref:Uncharacterized protein n=1 Tax=Periplaneta americana TaxID=6978 RepID=A0ABQ8TQ86_PERAM|nr:hypothetical protein ANN_09777 [Periplaneta americana]
MDLWEVGYDDRDWINLAKNKDRWRAYETDLVVRNGDVAPETIGEWYKVHTVSGGRLAEAISTIELFSVDEIGDSEMVFGEMRPRIRHRLLTFLLCWGKPCKTQAGIEPTPERNSESAGKRATA